MSPAETTTAIAEARLLLPPWGSWPIIVGYPVLAFVVTLLVCSLAALVAQPPLWKCPQTAHWMESRHDWRSPPVLRYRSTNWSCR